MSTNVTRARQLANTLAQGSVTRRVAGWIIGQKAAQFLPYTLRQRLRMLAVTARTQGAITPNARRLVTIVSHELSPTGAPKMVAEVTNACLAKGWGVVVVAPEDGPYATILADAGALVVISDTALWDISPALDFAQYSDILICNTIVSINVAGICRTTPVIWFLHETGLIDVYLKERPNTADVLASVAAVWATSPMIKDRIAAIRPNTIVVGACVETIKLVQPIDLNSKLRACVLGSVEPRKGQDLISYAHRNLPNVTRAILDIEFYGRELDHDFAQSWQKLIANDPSLFFGGVLSPEKVMHVINACDLVIIPSRDEPLSLVALEAMSAGKVVICTRAVGVADYLIDGESGYIAATPSVADLTEVLARALADREHWSEVGQAGREIYEREFTPTSFGRRIVEQIEGCWRDHKLEVF